MFSHSCLAEPHPHEREGVVGKPIIGFVQGEGEGGGGSSSLIPRSQSQNWKGFGEISVVSWFC